MSSSKQTKFSGTKAAGISILALCLLAFSQLLALLIGNMLVAGGMSAVTGSVSVLDHRRFCNATVGDSDIPVICRNVAAINLRSRNIKTACCRKCCIFRIGNWNRGRNGIPRNYYEFGGICMEPENCSDRSICPVWLSAY